MALVLVEGVQASVLVDALDARGVRAARMNGDAVEVGTDEVAAIVLAEDTERVLVDDCATLRELFPHVPVVVISPFSVEAALSAISAGAECVLPTPVDLDELATKLDELAQPQSQPSVERGVRSSLGPLLGSSPAMNALYELVLRVAHTDMTLLVTGETGTGKELVARTVHMHSRRANGPFVAVNCPGVAESLLESELFGHCRGAFTDARTQRAGLLVRASGGTLFLDEIGETTPAFQARLLRALQERVVRPVGSDDEVPFDARVITATNRNLESEIDAGRFRRDLFFRIDGVRIDVPPLRARGGDILLLADAFVRSCAAQFGNASAHFDNVAMGRLLGYPWPGNVRELIHCVQSAVALARSSTIGVDDLPEPIKRGSTHPASGPSRRPSYPTLAELERSYIHEVLEMAGGNKVAAARTLGLDRKTLYRRLRGYSAAPAASMSPPHPK